MAQKVALYILNSIFTIFGLILACGSIAFFMFINMFTILRERNHYVPDYNVYWPQAIPWMFFVTSLFVIFTFCCGFKGAKKDSKSIVTTYAIFVSVATVLLMGTAIVALVCADGPRTYNSIKDMIYDGLYQMKDNPEIEKYFGNVEKRLYCCGADSPRDYWGWRDEYPQSCCDNMWYRIMDHDDDYPFDCNINNTYTYYWIRGCSEVAVEYASIGIKSLSGVSICTGIIGILTLSVAIKMSKTIKNFH